MDDESEEKMTTFDEDMETVADLVCFNAPEFTTKVMQGVNLKCL